MVYQEHVLDSHVAQIQGQAKERLILGQVRGGESGFKHLFVCLDTPV